MVITGRTFRIFVSSTFSDFKLERDALREKVFPKLRKLCAENDASFEAVDLRWGVSQEAAKDQQTMTICFREIDRCREVSPRPNFIILIGDRYGWRPLPESIAAEEFDFIRQHLRRSLKERCALKLLEQWYRRDDNAVPPVYSLLSRAGRKNYFGWLKVERGLSQVLRRIVSELGLARETCIKFTASACEQEIQRRGVFEDSNPEDIFCFFREIHDLPPDRRAEDFIDLDCEGKLDAEAQALLSNLKHRLQSRLSENCHSYEAVWGSDGISCAHIEQLCADVHTRLARAIKHQLTHTHRAPDLDEELGQHGAFAVERTKFFTGRSSTLQTIRDYLCRPSGRPQILVGPPGSGKTTVMAQAATEAQIQRPDLKIIFRFVGATPRSNNTRELLESLCQQIYCDGSLEDQKNEQIFKIDKKIGKSRSKKRKEDLRKRRQKIIEEFEVPDELHELARTFKHFLGKVPREIKLAIFVDGLDQLVAEGMESWSWVPPELPENICIIVATLPGEVLNGLRLSAPEGHQHQLERMSIENGTTLLDSWLTDAHRTIQEDQRERILDTFSRTGMPLHLRLLFEEARNWRSDTPEVALASDVQGVIHDLYQRLAAEANHGQMLVSRSLSYLAAARSGLSQDELLDVLSRDRDVTKDFSRRSPWWSPEVEALPAIVWSRLRFDFGVYLVERTVDGSANLNFFHAQMRNIAEAMYLKDVEKKDRHRQLARYFAEQVCRSLEANTVGPGSHHALLQLPYHYVCAEMWRDLNETFTDFRFLQARVFSSGPEHLVEDFELALESNAKRRMEAAIGDVTDLEHILHALRTASHVIRQDPRQLAAQLHARLSYRLSMKISRLLSDSRPDHSPWLRPLAPSLYSGMSLQQVIGESVAGLAVAITPDGDGVIAPSDEKTLKVWNLRTGQEKMVLPGHTDLVRAIAVAPGAQIAVSVSEDRTLRTWDLRYPRTIKILNLRHYAPLTVAVSHDGRVAVVPAEEHLLRVWDLLSGRPLITLERSRRELESIATTPDGRLIIAARRGSLKVWDLHTCKAIRTIRRRSVAGATVAITGDGNLAFCPSRAGSLTVWDLRSGKRLKTMTNSDMSIRSIAATPDGRLALAASGEMLTVWNVHSGELVHKLTGHEGEVVTVAVSSDGRLAVSAAEDARLKVWDLGTGKAIRTLGRRNVWPQALALTPDGRTLVASSDNADLKVWDLRSGKLLKTIKGHDCSVEALAVTKDGEVAVSAACDRTLRVWNLRTGKRVKTLGKSIYGRAVTLLPGGQKAVVYETQNPLKVWDLKSEKTIKTLRGHIDYVTDLAISRDGTRMASASWDETVRLWDLTSGKTTWTIEKGVSGNAVALMPDGKQVITASDDNGLILLDVDKGREVKTFPGHSDWIEAVAISSDGRNAVSASRDTTLKLWDLKSGKLLQDLRGHANSVNDVAISADGKVAVSASVDQTVRVWNLGLESDLETLDRHENFVGSVAVSLDGRLAVSASDDETLKVWDVKSGLGQQTLRGDVGQLWRLVLTPDSRHAIAGSQDGSITLWDLQTGDFIRTLGRHRFSITALALSRNGRRLVSAGYDEVLRIWEFPSGDLMWVARGHTNLINALAITPDASLAISASMDKTLRVWDLRSEKLLYTLCGHPDSVETVAVTPDGRLAISGGINDPALRVWNLREGKLLNTLEGQAVSIEHVMILPGDESVVSASSELQEAVVEIWELTSGNLVRTLRGHSDLIQDIRTFPDGRRIVSVSQDHTVRIWNLSEGMEIDTFTSDGGLVCVAVAPSGKTIVVGEESGRVHFLRLEA